MAELMNRCSMLASLPSTLATRYQMSLSRQRAKYMDVLCRFLNSLGKQRHALLQRRIQKTVLRNRSLSFALKPGSLTLHGSNCSMRSYGYRATSFGPFLTQLKSQDMAIFNLQGTASCHVNSHQRIVQKRLHMALPDSVVNRL